MHYNKSFPVDGPKFLFLHILFVRGVFRVFFLFVSNFREIFCKFVSYRKVLCSGTFYAKRVFKFL